MKIKKIFNVILIFSLLASSILLGATPAMAVGTNYYVSQSSGNDSYDGLAPNWDGVHGPWRTLGKASGTYQPGDKLLLKCGDTWCEQLTVSGKATSVNPIILSSYGTGERPKIFRNDRSWGICIQINNPSGWKVINLELYNAKRGINIEYNNPTDYDNEYLWFEDLYCHDIDEVSRDMVDGEWFDTAAIEIALKNGLTGYDSSRTRLQNITLNNSRFENCFTSIYIRGGCFKNANITNIYTIDGVAPFCSDGMDGALIKNCTFIRPTALSVPWGSSGGYMGTCKNITWEDCEFAYSVRTDCPDGVGVDLEAKNRNITFRRCYFHDGDGEAIMLFNNGRNNEPDMDNWDTLIEDCLFAFNGSNPAPNKYVPGGEIYFTGKHQSGIIQNCRFYLLPGIPYIGGDGNKYDFTFQNNVITSTNECNGVNLALTATATASSMYDSNYSPGNCNDDIINSTWKSAVGTSSDEWLKLDLGTVKTVDKVILEQEPSSLISRYVIQYWNSTSSEWCDAYNGLNLGSCKQIPIRPVSTRYIRLYIYSTSSGSPAISEFRAYNVGSVSQSIHGPGGAISHSSMIVTSTSAHVNNGAEKAIDSNSSTIWHTEWDASEFNLSESITISLGGWYNVCQLKYLPRPADDGGMGNGNITGYKIYTSNDGINFTQTAQGTWVDDSTEKTAIFSDVIARYVKLEATSGHGGFAAASEINVVDMKTLPRSAMVITATSSQPGNEVKKAVDNNYSTIWHSQYNPPVSLPQSVTIDLGSIHNQICEIKYLPRPVNDGGMGNGNITGYKVYTSIDGINFTQTTQGTWTDDATEKTAVFSEISARYLKFEATSGHGGFASAAEINVRQHVTLNHSQMSVNATSSHINNEADKVLDGNNTTIWHSEWDSAAINLPHSITLEVDNTYNISELRYKPRPADDGGMGNGNITGYKIYSSNDGISFTQATQGTWADDATEKTALFSSINAKYVKLEATSGHGGFASASEINILYHGTIPQSEISAKATNQQSGNEADKVLDNNTSTFWHSQWDPYTPLPQSITLNLGGGTYNACKLRYLPRQDAFDLGIITSYNIYTSINGRDYNLVSSGIWSADHAEKTASFNPTACKYIKLEAVQGIGGYASAAEINIEF